MVSPLMREMVIGAMRWQIGQPLDVVGTAYFQSLALLCSEWIAHEAPLSLPSSDDQALSAAMEHTRAQLRCDLRRPKPEPAPGEQLAVERSQERLARRLCERPQLGHCRSECGRPALCRCVTGHAVPYPRIRLLTSSPLIFNMY